MAITIFAVETNLPRMIEHILVMIARIIPHHHLVAFFDELAAQLNIFQGGAAHMRERRLPANNFGHHFVD